MSDFNKAVEKVWKFEGILSNDKYDAGGLTKYGISKRMYPSLDIANLTQEQAVAIYKRDYWEKNLCDKIQSQEVAEQVFDIAVNGGLSCVQRAINSLLPASARIKEDGVIGAITLMCINKFDPKTLNNTIARYRARRFANICKVNSTQLVFLEGWIERCFRYII